MSFVEYDQEVEAVHRAAVRPAAGRPATSLSNSMVNTSRLSSLTSPLFDFPDQDLDHWAYRPPPPPSPLRSLSVAGMRSPAMSPVARAASVVDHVKDPLSGQGGSSRLVSNIDDAILAIEETEAVWHGTATDELVGPRAPIIHFSMNYDDDTTKFVFLTEVEDPSSLSLHPYSLQVVPKDELATVLSTSATSGAPPSSALTASGALPRAKSGAGKAYYTLSTNGVTRVSADGHTEFTPMASFVRAATLFKHLSALPVFRHFRFWKTIKVWRAFVRRRRFAANRKALLERIFVLHPMFQAALCDVHAFIEGTVLPARLFALELQNTLTMEELVDATDDALAKVKRLLASVLDEVKARVQRLIEDIRDPERIKVSASAASSARRTVSLRQIMLLEKQKALERARKAEMVNAELRVVGKLIRLVDYRILESFHELALKELSRLLNMAWHDNAMLLRVVLDFEPNSRLSFTPDRAAVLDQFDALVGRTVNTLIALPRVPFNQGFLQFISLSGMKPSQLSRDGPHLAAFLSSSDVYGPGGDACLSSLRSAIVQSFDDAQAYAELFSVVAPVHSFGVSWSASDYAAPWLEPDALQAPLDLAAIRADLTKLTKWDAMVSALHTASSRGMLLVDSKSLRENLAPIPIECKAEVLDLLTRIVAARIDTLSTRLEANIYKARGSPHSLTEYVRFAQFLATVPDEKEATRMLLDSIDAAKDLLLEHDVLLPSDTASDHSMVHSLFSQFLSVVAEAGNTKSELFFQYAGVLKTHVDALAASISSVAQALKAPHFASLTATPATLVAELDSLREQLASIGDHATEYAEYLDALGMPPSPVLELGDLTSQLDALAAVWKLSGDWAALELSFSSTPFVSLAEASLEQPVRELEARIAEAQATLPHHPVLAAIASKVAKLASAMPTLLELANPAMQPRHWIQIFAALGESYEHMSSSFTLPQLLSLDVVAHSDLVFQVSDIATGEAEIDAALENVASTWASTQLPTVPYSPDGRTVRKGMYLLAPLGDLLALLEADQLELSRMLSSKYVSGMQSQVEAIRLRLLSHSALLAEWETLQSLWRFMEPLFSSSTSISEALPSVAAKFKLVDRRFRMTMRAAAKASSLHEACAAPGLTQHLVDSRASLELAFRGLAAWLDARRADFPRFYLLSNTQLAHLYALAERPRALVRSIPLMSAIVGPGLSFQTSSSESAAVELIALDSGMAERLKFGRPLQTFGPPHTWLADALEASSKVLAAHVKSALASFDKFLCHDWVFKAPSQAILLVANIKFTEQVETALGAGVIGSGGDGGDSGAAVQDSAAETGKRNSSLRSGPVKPTLARLLQTYRQQLVTWAEIRSSPALAQHHAITIANYMVADMHRLELLRALITDDVGSIHAVQWTTQLRAYWDPALAMPLIRIQDAELSYGYEYHALVRYPMANSAALGTLGTTARWFASGSALGLAGPASSGKSETLRELALVAGRRLVVLDASPLSAVEPPASASPMVAFAPVAAFLRGVAAGGLWGVVRHASSLPLPALSLLSAAAVTLSRSIALGAESLATVGEPRSFMLLGRELRMMPTAGLALTCSPPLGSSATATGAMVANLPACLRSAFEISHTAVPDMLFLLEAALYSQGFRGAKSLASSLFVLNNLMEAEANADDPASVASYGLGFVLKVVDLAATLRARVQLTKESIVVLVAITTVFKASLSDSAFSRALSLTEQVFVRKTHALPPPAALRRSVATKLAEQLGADDAGRVRKHPYVLLALELFPLLALSNGVICAARPDTERVVDGCAELLAAMMNDGADAYLAMMTSEATAAAVDSLPWATAASLLSASDTPQALLAAMPKVALGPAKVHHERHDFDTLTRAQLVGQYVIPPTGAPYWVPGQLAVVLGALATKAELEPAKLFWVVLHNVPPAVAADILAPAMVQLNHRSMTDAPDLDSSFSMGVPDSAGNQSQRPSHVALATAAAAQPSRVVLPQLVSPARITWGNGESLYLPANLRLIVIVNDRQFTPHKLLAAAPVVRVGIGASGGAWLWQQAFADWVTSLHLNPTREEYVHELGNFVSASLAAYAAAMLKMADAAGGADSAPSSPTRSFAAAEGNDKTAQLRIQTRYLTMPVSQLPEGALPLQVVADAILLWLRTLILPSTSPAALDALFGFALFRAVSSLLPAGATEFMGIWHRSLVSRLVGSLPAGTTLADAFMGNDGSVCTPPEEQVLDPLCESSPTPSYWDAPLMCAFEWSALALDHSSSIVLRGPQASSKGWLLEQYVLRRDDAQLIRVSLTEPQWSERLLGVLETHLMQYTSSMMGTAPGTRLLVVVDGVPSAGFSGSAYLEAEAIRVLRLVTKLAANGTTSAQPLLGSGKAPGAAFPHGELLETASYIPGTMLGDDRRVSQATSTAVRAAWEDGHRLTLCGVQFAVVVDECGSAASREWALVLERLYGSMAVVSTLSSPAAIEGILEVRAAAALARLSHDDDDKDASDEPREMDPEYAEIATKLARVTAELRLFAATKLASSAWPSQFAASLGAAVAVMESLGELETGLVTPELATLWWAEAMRLVYVAPLGETSVLGAALNLRLKALMDDEGLAVELPEVSDDDGGLVFRAHSVSGKVKMVTTKAFAMSVPTVREPRLAQLALPWLVFASREEERIGAPMVASGRTASSSLTRAQAVLGTMTPAEHQAMDVRRSLLEGELSGSAMHPGDLAQLGLALFGPRSSGALVVLRGPQSSGLALSRAVAGMHKSKLIEISGAELGDLEQRLKLCYIASGIEGNRVTVYVPAAVLERVLAPRADEESMALCVLSLLLSPSSSGALVTPFSQAEFRQLVGTRRSSGRASADALSNSREANEPLAFGVLVAQFNASVRQHLRVVVEGTEQMAVEMLARPRSSCTGSVWREAFVAAGRAGVVRRVVSLGEVRDNETYALNVVKDLTAQLPLPASSVSGVASVALDVCRRLESGSVVVSVARLIRLALTLYCDAKTYTGLTASRAQSALNTLQAAGERLQEIRNDVARFEPQVQAQLEEAEELTGLIVETETRLAGARGEMTEAEGTLMTARQSRDAQEAYMAAKLGEVMPVLDKYRDRLRLARAEDVSDLASVHKPFDGLVFTMEAITMLTGVESPNWKDVMELLGEANAPAFLEWARTYEPASMTDNMRSALKRMLAHDGVVLSEVAAASPPLGGDLCGWVQAVHEVAITHAKLRVQQATIDELDRTIKDAQDALDDAQEKAKHLGGRLQRLKSQKAKLSKSSLQASVSSSMEELQLMTSSMASVAPMAEALSAVQVEMSAREATLLGDAVVSAAQAVFGRAGEAAALESVVSTTLLVSSSLEERLGSMPAPLAEKTLPRPLVYCEARGSRGSGFGGEDEIAALPPSALLQRLPVAETAFVRSCGASGRWLLGALRETVYSAVTPVLVDPDNLGVPALRELEGDHDLREVHVSSPYVDHVVTEAMVSGRALLVHGFGRSLETGLTPLLRAVLAGVGYLETSVVGSKVGEGGESGDDSGMSSDDEAADPRSASEVFQDMMRAHARARSSELVGGDSSDEVQLVERVTVRMTVTSADGDAENRAVRRGFRLFLVSREREIEVPDVLAGSVHVVTFAAPPSVGEAHAVAMVTQQIKPALAKQVSDIATRLASESHLVSSLYSDAVEMLLTEKFVSKQTTLVDDNEALSGLALSMETFASATATVLKLEVRLRRLVALARESVAAEVAAVAGLWRGASRLQPAVVGLERLSSAVTSAASAIVASNGETPVAQLPKMVFDALMQSLPEDAGLSLAFFAAAEASDQTDAEKLSATEWRVLVDGAQALEDVKVEAAVLSTGSGVPSKPRESWLTAELWNMLGKLEADVGAFDGLLRSVVRDIEVWYTFIHSSAPLSASTSTPSIVERLSPLRRCVLVRLVRPDVLETAMRQVVKSALGVHFSSLGIVSVDEVGKREALVTVLVREAGRQVETWVARWWRETVLEREGANKARLVFVASGSEADIDVNEMRDELERGSWLVVFAASEACGRVLQCAAQVVGGPSGGRRVGWLRKKAPYGRIVVVADDASEVPGEIVRVADVVRVDWPRQLKRALLVQYATYSRLVASVGGSLPRVLRRVLFGLALAVAHVCVRRGMGAPHGFVDAVELSEGRVAAVVAWLRERLASLPHHEAEDEQAGAFVPFSELRSMVSAVMVSTVHGVDSAVLELVMEACLGEFLFDEKHALSASNHNMHPPPFGSLAYHVLYIRRAFPEVVPLDVLGLRNKLAVRLAELRLPVVVRERIAPVVDEHRGWRVACVGRHLCTINELTTLVQRVQSAVPVELPPRGSFSQPMFDHVLETEAAALGAVLNAMHVGLGRLLDVVRGRRELDAALYSQWLSLMDGRVPDGWASGADGLPLWRWLDQMRRKVAQMSNWRQHGLPVVVNLGLLHAPKKLLARLLVVATRTSGSDAPLHAFGFDFVVQRAGVIPREHPPVGVYVGNLVLENAAWDGGQKVLVEPSGHAVGNSMPVVWVRPVDVGQLSRDRLVYAAPLYCGDTSRVIIDMALPISGDESFWRMRGVCLRTE
ncbi:uncharacterized protein AMSG_05539 [Thecamonas trahens ATCC 50062]|uniref:Dynein heavy chain n=1 Tax=Thecamonas trahens ATCC 50062 TaxID=461836 RepID=A0A0L0DB08_THETB|nr:hypothetical protein AMSG_05539 [Thecamonas trahens ATCC 50062]KNC49517.1 hypothetical protein AMSG_05539 [Thecamonas trahens ATCC 50062]|eukprot:XP_013757633.1 hypothetical protein AMSG_05539 [Thecamonas trahens ATCC 50062]